MGLKTLLRTIINTKTRHVLLRKMPKNSVCAEIGVYKGDFSKKILSIVNPKKLHLIDPWQYESEEVYKTAWYGGGAGSQRNMDDVYQEVVDRFKVDIESGKIVMQRKSSESAIKDIPDNYFDWIYIDANHQYEFAKKDLELYYNKVKKQGFITGDDYTEGGWWQGGVKKAVDEFIQKELVRKRKILGTQFILQK